MEAILIPSTFPSASLLKARFPAKTSTSSKKITAGSAARASANVWRMVASAAPTNGENTLAGESVKKVTPLDVAAARARELLLQPGGPYSKKPRAG